MPLLHLVDILALSDYAGLSGVSSLMDDYRF